MKIEIFEAFAETGSGRRAATLLARHKTTPRQLFDALHVAVVAALPNLTDGSLYTTQQLCGPALWANWSIAERRVVGMCLAYQVKVFAVALVLHRTPSGKGKKRYCLADVKKPADLKSSPEMLALAVSGTASMQVTL